MTQRRLAGVVSSFCDTTSSSLSSTTLGNFHPPLFSHLQPSYAISTFVVSLLSLRFCLESSALVFRRNTINHFSRSSSVTPPFTPSDILEEDLVRQRRALSSIGRMCDLPDDDYRGITHLRLSYVVCSFILSQRIVDASIFKRNHMFATLTLAVR